MTSLCINLVEEEMASYGKNFSGALGDFESSTKQLKYLSRIG